MPIKFISGETIFEDDDEAVSPTAPTIYQYRKVGVVYEVRSFWMLDGSCGSLKYDWSPAAPPDYARRALAKHNYYTAVGRK